MYVCMYDDDVRPPSSEMTMTSLVWGVGAEMTDEANPRTKQAVALGTREAVSWARVAETNDVWNSGPHGKL